MVAALSALPAGAAGGRPSEAALLCWVLPSSRLRGTRLLLLAGVLLESGVAWAWQSSVARPWRVCVACRWQEGADQLVIRHVYSMFKRCGCPLAAEKLH